MHRFNISLHEYGQDEVSHPFFILFAKAYLWGESESITPTSVLIQHNLACLLNPIVYVGF